MLNEFLLMIGWMFCAKLQPGKKYKLLAKYTSHLYWLVSWREPRIWEWVTYFNPQSVVAGGHLSSSMFCWMFFPIKEELNGRLVWGIAVKSMTQWKQISTVFTCFYGRSECWKSINTISWHSLEKKCFKLIGLMSWMINWNACVIELKLLFL